MIRPVKLKDLASQIIENFNNLHINEARCIQRAYEKTFWIASLTVADLVSPTDGARTRLEDLMAAINESLLCAGMVATK